MESLPYTAISVSIFARFIFMYLLYKNRSTNTYSLTFCLMNIGSSGMWLAYSDIKNDTAMLIRSVTEISLLFASCIYICRNKYKKHLSQAQIVPV